MTTTKLGLTETANGQANYLNVNTALSRLDQLVFARVVDRYLSAPPGSPANGAMYIPAATATGAWAGKENNLAWWLTAANQWFFLAPAEGMGLVYVLDEDEFIYHNGTAWTVFSGGGGGATDAADVSIADAGGYFSSSDVEGALQELGAASAPSLTNPMTTAGDIIVGGTGGVPERLGKGTDGQVLTLVSGAQAWAAPTGGAAWGAITGMLSAQTDLQAALDAKASVGIPQNSKSANYTLVLSDNGKHIFHPSADTTARIFTIPANSSVAFPVGAAVTFVNQNAAGVLTIAITSDTMRLAGPGTTGSRTLAANGTATALKVTSTEWIISGVGLT